MQVPQPGAISGPDCPYAIDERVARQRDPPADAGNGLADGRAVRAVPNPRVRLAHHDTDYCDLPGDSAGTYEIEPIPQHRPTADNGRH
jgi:hypothetical protein